MGYFFFWFAFFVKFENQTLFQTNSKSHSSQKN